MRTIVPDFRIAPPRLSTGMLAAVILVHAGILASILSLPKTTQSITPPVPLYVRLIEAATAQPELAPPPVPPRLQPPPTPSVPPPVLAAPPAPLRPIPEAVKAVRQPQPAEPVRPEVSRPEPQPAPTPTPAPATVEAPKPAPPVTQPRFNADYLDNPKPPYPGISRRMGEEGEVRLRVHVDPAGNAQQIEIARSSGFPRLDQAALDTVKQWRFIPARQGEQPIAAWVIVPIQFSLRS